MTGVLMKGGNSDTDTHRQGECPVKMQGEVGVVLLSAKEQQRLPANTRSTNDSPSCARKKPTLPKLSLDFQPPELPGNQFQLLRPPECGALLWPSWKMNPDAKRAEEWKTDFCG